jgi:hypothetical protein
VCLRQQVCIAFSFLQRPPCGAIGATFRFFPRHCRNRSNPDPSFETQNYPGIGGSGRPIAESTWTVRRCPWSSSRSRLTAESGHGAAESDATRSTGEPCIKSHKRWGVATRVLGPGRVTVQIWKVQVQVVACPQLPATACNFSDKNRNLEGPVRPLDRLARQERTRFFLSLAFPAWVRLVLPHCGSVSSTRALGPPACVQLAWHTPPPHRRPPRRTPAFSEVSPPRSVVQALFSPMRAGLLAYRIPSHFPARSRFALLPVPFADFPPAQVPRNSRFLFSPELGQSANQAPSVASFSGGARPLRH